MGGWRGLRGAEVVWVCLCVCINVFVCVCVCEQNVELERDARRIK